MATAPRGPQLGCSVARWVWLVRAAALLSAAVLGIIPLLVSKLTVFVLPLLVPYLLIAFWPRRSGKLPAKMLSLARATGLAAIVGLFLGLLHEPTAACFALLVLQVVLVRGAGAAQSAVQKQTGEQPPERRGLTLFRKARPGDALEPRAGGGRFLRDEYCECLLWRADEKPRGQ